MTIEFFVHGIPAPGGSKRAVTARNGKAYLIDACKRNKPWRDSVAAAAVHAMRGRELLTGPISFRLRFSMPRPKNHYRTGKHTGQLKETAPTYHTSKPDATKLIRAAEDALKGIVWRDDAQVASQAAIKIYSGGEEPYPGLRVEIREL
jgi:crossover junction endodeoxyribonuclease RusA